ncbi:MAG: DUF2867 domain-containing protein [Peptococcaceae bacterium]|nr:DUF2867 domain-containing protein [Peptococcaceae bacterium]
MPERKRFDYEDRMVQTITHSQRMRAVDLFRLIFMTPPKPVAWLLMLRDRLMKPFGVKTDSDFKRLILFETENKIVLGQRDKHLDFYVSLTCAPPIASRQDFCVSTCVNYHNVFGKLYFGCIRFVHIVLVKYLLKRAAKIWVKNQPRY